MFRSRTDIEWSGLVILKFRSLATNRCLHLESHKHRQPGFSSASSLTHTQISVCCCELSLYQRPAETHILTHSASVLPLSLHWKLNINMQRTRPLTHTNSNIKSRLQHCHQSNHTSTKMLYSQCAERLGINTNYLQGDDKLAPFSPHRDEKGNTDRNVEVLLEAGQT